jgi:hypothetical protein
MTPDQLCVVTAVALAAAFLNGPAAPEAELEPQHPAFAGFRRMNYIWTDGQSLLPVGDLFRIWLDFLRERGVVDVWLDLRGTETVGRTRHADGDDAWRATDDGELLTMRGSSEPAGPPPAVDVAAAAAALRESLEIALPSALTAARDGELRTALAILDASDDAGEQSGVDWPYFVLPDRAYGVDARRLFAAAAIAWPAAEEPSEPLLRRSRDAAMAAVNSGRTRA